MDRLGGLVVIAPARRGGDPDSNPGPGESFSLKLLIICLLFVCLNAFFSHLFVPSNPKQSSVI